MENTGPPVLPPAQVDLSLPSPHSLASCLVQHTQGSLEDEGPAPDLGEHISHL